MNLMCAHTQAHSQTWFFPLLHLCQCPVVVVLDPYETPHSHGAWQLICPIEPSVDVSGDELRAVSLLLEAEWILCRGLAFLLRLQMRAWDSELKVDFLHS